VITEALQIDATQARQILRGIMLKLLLTAMNVQLFLKQTNTAQVSPELTSSSPPAESVGCNCGGECHCGGNTEDDDDDEGWRG